MRVLMVAYAMRFAYMAQPCCVHKAKGTPFRSAHPSLADSPPQTTSKASSREEKKRPHRRHQLRQGRSPGCIGGDRHNPENTPPQNAHHTRATAVSRRIMSLPRWQQNRQTSKQIDQDSSSAAIGDASANKERHPGWMPQTTGAHGSRRSCEHLVHKRGQTKEALRSKYSFQNCIHAPRRLGIGLPSNGETH